MTVDVLISELYRAEGQGLGSYDREEGVGRTCLFSARCKTVFLLIRTF